MKTMLNASNIF